MGKPAVRRAGTAGIEPALVVLETAVLPLNYVPKKEAGQRKTARQASLGAAPVDRLRALPRNLPAAVGIREA